MFKVGDVVIYMGEHPDHENEYGPCEFPVGTLVEIILWGFGDMEIEKDHFEIKPLNEKIYEEWGSQRATIASLQPATELNKLIYS